MVRRASTAGLDRRWRLRHAERRVRPQSMQRMYFSRKYYNSPMPHSIFFYYGFAIHGTTDIVRLGGPASRGCVRLHRRMRRRCMGWSSAVARGARASSSTRIDFNQNGAGDDSLNRPITLSIIEKYSCAHARFRAFIMQSG
jgi:L,D-transpeptidase catalytic domain